MDIGENCNLYFLNGKICICCGRMYSFSLLADSKSMDMRLSKQWQGESSMRGILKLESSLWGILKLEGLTERYVGSISDCFQEATSKSRV